MNLLDLALVALLILAAYSGFRRGASLQVFSYGGLIVGLLIGALVAPRLADLARDPYAQALIAMGALLAFAGIGDGLGWLIGRRVWVAAQRSRLGTADAAAGSVVGIVAALLAVWFLAFNFVQGPFRDLSHQIRSSTIVQGIDAVLPRPPSLLNHVRQVLDRVGFPEVFQGLPPAPAGPVEGPTSGQVGEAIDAADQSTFRIIGEACGRIQEGSGFLVADGYVVTNAHVLAGVDAPQVQQQDGGSIAGTTVLFDDDLDLAVLRIETSPAKPLDLLAEELGRGAKGAVLGFPQGGPLTGGAAAVRQQITATGRDIYGQDSVRREVYELQAEVRPGNSGGPFVTLDGDVAGVVFAASTTNRNVGYALTSQEVMPRVNQAVGRTQPVDTGPCIR
ncbi:MAG: MarP family serine protease [Actinomycetota bacterium]